MPKARGLSETLNEISPHRGMNLVKSPVEVILNTGYSGRVNEEHGNMRKVR
jgi:hypothetical protein